MALVIGALVGAFASSVLAAHYGALFAVLAFPLGGSLFAGLVGVVIAVTRHQAHSRTSVVLNRSPRRVYRISSQMIQ
jgi:tetrahydromethanopterin S-methyltransferase subunit E